MRVVNCGKREKYSTLDRVFKYVTESKVMVDDDAIDIGEEFSLRFSTECE